MDPLNGARKGMHRLAAAEDVGAVRRLVHELATEMGASAADCGRAELATTELGTNTLHHARPPGYLLVQALAAQHGRGLEILAVDRGPGIRDLAAVLDGGTGPRLLPRPPPAGAGASGLGCGLASVRRLASEFDIHTVRDRGTVVLARFFFERRAQASCLRCGAVSLPLPGELANGDAWAFASHRSGGTLLVVDGLGHGPAAAEAAEAAVAVFRRNPELELESYLREAHAALRSTRGAAVSLARIFVEENRVQFAGVGNVEGRIQHAARSVGLVPRNGTLGMNLQPPKLEVRELAWEPGSNLVLHSDGVRSPSQLGELGALRQRDPSLIAGVFHRDLARGRDDATVVVVQDMRAIAP